MKTLIFIIVLLLGAPVLYAEPFLTCDPQEGVTKYKVIVDNGDEVISDANADGSAWHDINYVPEGLKPAEIYAGAYWTIDGVPQLTITWSDPHPFVLGRPSISQSPTSITLKNNH